jgi:hypothetical protein
MLKVVVQSIEQKGSQDMSTTDLVESPRKTYLNPERI